MALGVGCHKSSGGTDTTTETTHSATISGKVTYSRVPLVVNDQGIPTGLETDPTKFTTLPARGVTLRLWMAEDETNSLGQTVHPWRRVAETTTSISESTFGNYTFSVSYKDGAEAFVELVSEYSPSSGSPIRLIADPAGVESTVPQSERLIYLLRKGVGGKLPDAAPIPADPLKGNATVDFTVGQDTSWWLNNRTPTEAVLSQAVKESTPTGSRVLGILDTFTDYALTMGSAVLGATLDLHYRPGVSHPRGSFIEYDRTKYPMAFDAGGWHYFGSLRGGLSNDDAWDRHVIATLAARNNAFSSYGTPWTFPNASDPWSSAAGNERANLHPTAAFQQGAVLLMAALSQKSPYLADTSASGSPRVIDIRNVGSAPRDIFSAPNLCAMGWEILLKANSLPSPGTPTDWVKMSPAVTARYFSPVAPKDSNGKQTDIISTFGQLARLQEDRATTETVDLKAIFTNDVLKALVQPFGVTWPRPTTGELAGFLADWGTDFTPATGSTLFSKTFTLSMASAQPDGLGLYPNDSKGETAHALYATTKDQAYFLDVTPLPPAGAKLEVRFTVASGTSSYQALRTFESTTPADPADPLKRIVILTTTTTSNSTTTKAWYPISIHLVSPTAKLPDYTFTLTLRPTL